MMHNEIPFMAKTLLFSLILGQGHECSMYCVSLLIKS